MTVTLLQQKKVMQEKKNKNAQQSGCFQYYFKDAEKKNIINMYVSRVKF